jgi:hypothetical protein
MAKRRTDSNRQSPRRRDLATWLMMLLPGFMFVGMLAPAAIHVKPKAQSQDYGPISFRNFTPRRAIQFPLAITNALAPSESGGAGSVLDPMFSGARYVADQARRVFDPAAKTESNEIVLAEDNMETYVAETLFEAPIDEQQQLVVDLTPLWDPNLFDVIPFIFDKTAHTQWEDFHGAGLAFPAVLPTPGPVVPEPATGGLLALGLVALALRRPRA